MLAHHFGVNTMTSVMDTPGTLDLAVRTVYREGSLWSLSTTAVLTNFSEAYLYGT